MKRTKKRRPPQTRRIRKKEDERSSTTQLNAGEAEDQVASIRIVMARVEESWRREVEKMDEECMKNGYGEPERNTGGE